MKALTVWQPWASLIMIGAKPHEFRRWDYRKRASGLVGQRIVIHAGARKMEEQEIADIFERIDAGESALNDALAVPFLKQVALQVRYPRDASVLTYSVGLGTAILGKPQRVVDLFRGKVADSSRLDEHMWAWPLTDIKPWMPPIECRGAQGFWTWPFKEAA